jgi:hypothetical protein
MRWRLGNSYILWLKQLVSVFQQAKTQLSQVTFTERQQATSLKFM